jgi:hypothetical protein
LQIAFILNFLSFEIFHKQTAFSALLFVKGLRVRAEKIAETLADELFQSFKLWKRSGYKNQPGVALFSRPYSLLYYI